VASAAPRRMRDVVVAVAEYGHEWAPTAAVVAHVGCDPNTVYQALKTARRYRLIERTEHRDARGHKRTWHRLTNRGRMYLAYRLNRDRMEAARAADRSDDDPDPAPVQDDDNPWAL